MPTYEYMCRKCGETMEVFQSFSDKPLKKHSACGGELKKVFHARGIVFKGSGFYATDSKEAPSTKTPAKSESAKTESSKTESSKTESSKGSKEKASSSSSTDS